MFQLTCFLVGFLGTCSLEFSDLIFELDEKSNFNQLRMLFENDIFVRRRSKISVATNGKDKFCIGFWEYTEEEMKYLIYDFQTQKKGNIITRFTRSCFNQKDLANSGNGGYCLNIINKISNGVYTTQNQIKYRKDYSEFFNGSMDIAEDNVRINLGDYRYVFK